MKPRRTPTTGAPAGPADNAPSPWTPEHAEAVFRTQFEQGHTGICFTGTDRQWLHVNRRLCEMFGYSEDELTQKTWPELTHPEDAKRDVGTIEQILIGERNSYDTDKRYIRKDGSVLHAHTSVVAFRREDMSVAFMVASVRDISDSVEALDRLRQARDTLYNILDSVPQSIFWKDRNGVYLGCNRPFAIVVGAGDETGVVGRTDYDLVPSRQIADDYRAADLEVIMSGEAKRGLARSGIRADGSRFWSTTSKIPLLDPSGSVWGVLGVHEDVTASRGAEEALREQVRLTDVIQRAQSSFIAAADTHAAFDGLLADILDLTGSKFGFIGEAVSSAEHLPYLRTLAISNVAWNEETHYFYERHARTGLEFFNLDTLFGYPLKTGTVLISNNPASDPRRGGLPAGHPLIHAFLGYPIAHHGDVYAMVGLANRPGGYSQDIVEHLQPLMSTIGQLVLARKSEAARRTAESSLRERDAAVATSLSGVAMADLGGQLTYVNDAFLRIWGYQSADEVVGRSAVAFWKNPEDAVRVIAGIHETGRFAGRMEGVRKDGSTVPIEVLGSAYADESGRPVGMMAWFADMTETVRAEQERLDFERRLLHTQKLESLGVLAGGIAHDFNNLLMAVLGNLDLAVQQLSPTSLALSSIEQAIQASRRATDLTRQMLAYSGRGRFVVTRIDLADLLRENADLFRASISRTVTLNLVGGGPPPVIDADAGQIQQIVMNLITNASDAIGARPGAVRLESGVMTCTDEFLARSRVENRPPAGLYAFIEVADNGAGMDEETLQRLFDPFFTTKFTGRGLGMSAVLGIVRGHKGAIIVDSAPGVGTTIRVLFPAAAVPAAAVAQAPVDGTTSPAGRVRQYTILVVDDDPAVRQLCNAFVERLGHRALVGEDGEDGLRMFREHASEIDCVLLDLTMPRMDGVSACKAMRDVRPDVRVVLASGYAEQDATERFDGMGLTGFIQKPFRLQELKDMLAVALAGLE